MNGNSYQVPQNPYYTKPPKNRGVTILLGVLRSLFWPAIFLVVMFGVTIIAVTISMIATGNLDASGITIELEVALMIISDAIIVIAFLLWRNYKHDWTDYGFTRRVKVGFDRNGYIDYNFAAPAPKFTAQPNTLTVGAVAICVLCGIGVWLFTLGFVGITDLWSFSPETEESVAQMTSLKGFGFLLVALYTAVVAPIAEEFVTRGAVLGRLRKYVNPYIAVVVAAAVFGLLHMNPTQFIYTFISGIIFGLAVLWTNSVWAGVIQHFVLNGVQILLAFIFRDAAAEGAVESAEESASSDIIFYIVTIIIGIVIIAPCLVFLFSKRYKKPAEVAVVATSENDGNGY